MTIIEFYSEGYPSGRCLYFGKALADFIVLPPKECLYLAKELFNFQFTEENPIKMYMKDDVDIEELKAICKKNGIEVRIRKDTIP